MYSVENPVFPKKLTPLEVAQYGPRFTGVGAQILGADDKYICQYSEESQNFWGSKNVRFMLLKIEFFFFFSTFSLCFYSCRLWYSIYPRKYSKMTDVTLCILTCF